MRIIVMEDFSRICEAAADLIADVIRSKPDARLGLATGSTAEGVYSRLIRIYQEGKLDFSGVSSANLDEYLGLKPDHPQSYRHFMDMMFFDHVNIDKRNTFVPSGVGDMEENIREFRRQIQKAPIDLQLLGVGVNGHIGFNEPGEALYDSAHVTALDPSTIQANARFFDDPGEVPTQAVTMGVGEILRAKKLLLLAAGAKKADAIGGLLFGERLDPRNPVTMIQVHPDATVMIDRELADRIHYED